VNRGTFVALAGVLLACGGPEPKSAHDTNEGVPANSIQMSRLHDDEKPAKSAPPPEDDPTQPYTVPIGANPTPPSSDGAGAPAAGAGSKKNGAASGKGGAVVSRAECNQVLDRYLELEFASNPQLKNVPPEMRQQVIEQAKAQARQEKGEAPCDATRSQYTCAMSAPSAAAWQRCMK
jgi:hypothetical protein